MFYKVNFRTMNSQTAMLTQRQYTPSVHQRRLWQRERKLEEEARQLNLMLAAYYYDQRKALQRVFSSFAEIDHTSWFVLVKVKIGMTWRCFKVQLVEVFAKLFRSKMFTNMMYDSMWIAIRFAPRTYR